MDRPIDLERLSQVFTDHPWLADAISNGAWWGNGDGSIRFVAPLEDPVEVRFALVAFAEALGCAPEDVLAARQAPSPSSTSSQLQDPSRHLLTARRVGVR